MNLLRFNRPHFYVSLLLVKILNVDNLKTCKDSLQMSNNLIGIIKNFLLTFVCMLH